MLTVPEQLLLITLDTDRAEFLKLPEEYNRAAFAGAALMELALAGRIRSFVPHSLLQPLPARSNTAARFYS